MKILVIGGSASGKSEYAERRAAGLGGELIYIATMPPFGEGAQARIQRHRAMRAERGFVTIERYTDIGGTEVPAGATVLLECAGNLAANEIFSPEGAHDRAYEAIADGVLALASRCANLITVSNDVFADGGGYPPETMEYLRVLSTVNRKLAAVFDEVIEVVCGIPCQLRTERGRRAL